MHQTPFARTRFSVYHNACNAIYLKHIKVPRHAMYKERLIQLRITTGFCRSDLLTSQGVYRGFQRYCSQ